MTHDCSLDLRVARLKAGLTEADVCHLLDSKPARLADLENTGQELSLSEARLLALIYNRDFTQFFNPSFEACISDLAARFENLPTPIALPTDDGQHTAFNRLFTLSVLAERLTDHRRQYD